MRTQAVGLDWHRVVPSGLWEGNLWDRLPSRIQIALNDSAFSLLPQSGSPMPAEANGLGDARPATRQAPTGADLNGGAQGRLPGRSIAFCHVLARASGWCFRVSGSCFCGNFLSARLWPRRTCAVRAGALGVKRSFHLGLLWSPSPGETM